MAANDWPKIKIVIGNHGRSKESGIYIDGVKIPRTHNIEFTAPVNDLPSIRVDMWAGEVEIECDDAEMTFGVTEIRELVAAERKRRAEEEKPAETTQGVRFREFL